jgi:hypothetical protein
MAYDAKAVKIPKAVKQLASTCATKEQRRQLIKDFVEVAETALSAKSNRSKGK